MKRFAFILVALCAAQFASSQQIETEPIQADRPDQTETPALVPKGMFQAEIGFNFEHNRKDDRSFVLPTALWKYGVNENFELRLITEFTSNEIASETTSGLNPVLIGFKARLCEQLGIVPKISFIGHLQLPDLASKELKADHYAALFRLAMQHSLRESWSISYNLGAEWDGISPQATFLYTLTTGVSITPKLGCYAEVFGFAPEEQTAYHSFDAGLTYLVSNDFMLDASSGFGLTRLAPDYYVAIGCSFRL